MDKDSVPVGFQIKGNQGNQWIFQEVYLLFPLVEDINPLIPLIAFDGQGFCYKFQSKPEDKYYIKRLVGEPGDELEMRVPPDIYTNGTNVVDGVPGVLYRNGKPIEGKNAFEQNRLRTENLAKDPNAKPENAYPGYRADALMSNRQVLNVPTKNSPGNPTGQNAYFAMGDNSTDSLDGRAWGFVPEQAIVGRAFLVYYPFAKKRWGLPDKTP